MTINQIECFVEVAKERNISKAARNLFITQQAASNQIKMLEKELGFPVLIRKNKGVSLTKEGEILFETWAEMQEKFRISVDKARDYHKGRSMHIHVGLEDMGKCSEEIMSAFSEYEKTYTDLYIDFEIMSPKQIITQFEAGTLDLAILYESEFENLPQLKSIPLHDKMLKVCIYMSGNHPLVQSGKTALDDIKDEPIGVLRKDYSLDFEKKINRFFEINHVRPPRMYREYASRRELEIGLIAGRCVTVVYETMFDDENSKLFSREVAAGSESSRIAIFWKERDMDTKARALGNILREKLRRCY